VSRKGSRSSHKRTRWDLQSADRKSCRQSLTSYRCPVPVGKQSEERERLGHVGLAVRVTFEEPVGETAPVHGFPQVGADF